MEGTGPQLLTVADADFSPAEPPSGALRLDLACGQQKREGFLGVDLDPTVSDLVHDLTVLPWPWEDSSVYELSCSHYVEHVEDLGRFMAEAYRVLMPLGLFTLTGPYYTHMRAHQDFTHRRLLTELTMRYFDQPWLRSAKVDHYGVTCDFESINTVLIFAPEWETRADEAKLWAKNHYWNVVEDIQYVLRARKPMR